MLGMISLNGEISDMAFNSQGCLWFTIRSNHSRIMATIVESSSCAKRAGLWRIGSERV